MELILHKVCGHPAQQAVTLRRCTPDEAPAVYALQNEVHAAMPHPEWFVTDTLEHITGYITDSLCIGVWQGSRLGAYLTFHYCGQSPHNYAAFLGVPQAEWPHWANVDSAVVHPDWRGNGLQRRMLEAALPLLPESITHLGLRVHHPCPPRNVRWVRPLPAGKGAVKRKELLHDEMQQLFVVYNAVGAGWKLTAAR